ncbi:T9SS type A sorting domain-containing protein [Taibaiella koreensis]|uniref:T9SS type A sorting domain-containing protein n=1 Tax=Taibaiella koreensis TaxID=1268548 RepID=UPI0013C3025E|nr:T9SS type A sorting domain-containing protein [Taibaiella koreensis]
MKQLYTTRLYLSMALLMGPGVAMSQGPGSVSTYGGTLATITVAPGGTHTDVSETLYIGPGHYQVDGTWDIYSKYIAIDPTAVVTGTGTINFFNASAAGGAAGPTLIDGNDGINAIAVNMTLQNTSGMALTNTDFPADLTAAGFTNNTATSTLYIGNDLNLAVDGAHVTLGTGATGDLRFDSDATISNYSPARMIITSNSTLSHTVKDVYTGVFTFPVGIAAGDYTPAQITNTTANGMHVSIQDYAGSVSDEPAGTTGNGITRTWNIYADIVSGNSGIALQHNNSTNQSAFNDAEHFVTRNGSIPNSTGDNPSLSSWQSNTPGAGTTGDLSSTGTVTGSSLRSRTYTDFATTASATAAYYSKSSNPITPLPVALVGFAGNADKCTVTLWWETANERDLDHFAVEYGTDGKNFSVIGRVTGSNTAHGDRYTFVTQQAGSTGMYRLSIVDLDGSVTKSKVVTMSAQCEADYTSWSVYPTPAELSDEIIISINTNKNRSDLRLIVVSMLGQELVNDKLDISPGISSFALPAARWAKGSYIITLIDSKGNRVGKANRLVLK